MYQSYNNWVYSKFNAATISLNRCFNDYPVYIEVKLPRTIDKKHAIDHVQNYLYFKYRYDPDTMGKWVKNSVIFYIDWTNPIIKQIQAHYGLHPVKHTRCLPREFQSITIQA